MPGKNELLGKLPAFNADYVLIKQRQSTNDLINAISSRHKVFANDYNNICLDFLGNDEYETAENIYYFLRDNVDYVEEGIEAQTVRSPAAIIATGKTIGADCKNYSLFAGGILDALNRRGANIVWCYRFAGYNYIKKELGHVFVVINPKTQDEIWIDAVLDKFDDRSKPPVNFTDKKVSAMALYQMSGIKSIGAPPPVKQLGTFGEFYMPVNPAGDVTDEAFAHALLKYRLECDAQTEYKNGTLKPGTARAAKYMTAISNLNQKIDGYEKGQHNFGKPVKTKISGGILSLLWGGDQLKTMQATLPSIALDFLYLYIPMNTLPADPNWLEAQRNNYRSIMPAIVVQKRDWAELCSWHWGSWGDIHVETYVYPLMHGLITKMLGMTPEAFWSNALGLPITIEDNGVYAGTHAAPGTDQSGLVEQLMGTVTSILNSSGIVGGTVSAAFKIAFAIPKAIFSGIINNLEMIYPVSSFTPSPSDWVGSKWQPFPNGFPPLVGIFAPAVTITPAVDTINPNNPVATNGSGGGNSNLLLFAGLAALVVLHSNHHKN